MSTLQQNRMRTLLPEEALSRVARCRRTPKVTFRSAKTGSSEVRVRACSSSGELVGSEQPRKQAKKPFGITIRFPPSVSLCYHSPALCSIPTSSFCQPSSRSRQQAIQSVTTPYKEGGGQTEEWKESSKEYQSNPRKRAMRIGEDQKKDCIRLLRESPPSLVSKLHENKGNRANKHDHKIWAIKSIFCEINNSAGF